MTDYRIEASDKSISALLKDQKFYIDYFQREYRWQEKHVKLLIDDLASSFLRSYSPDHERNAVASYQTYYLGPVVFSHDSADGKQSIIDGQQRITSITLLLIYLNHQQCEQEVKRKTPIESMICSHKYGEKSFNMTDETRQPCLKALFEKGDYDVTEGDDETVGNIVERYRDIEESFPEDLKGDALPYFIDWLIEKVIIVEIRAHSDENAYVIFETMNDRGLNLTPSEMLKGYVLSRITDSSKRIEINDLWKEQIQRLHEYGETADSSFFQAWFRAKYAKTMRPAAVGAENKDFELVGTQFHNWFKDNHKKLFGLKASDEFYDFFKNQFPFFVGWYINSIQAQENYDSQMPHLHYIHSWGVAESLQYPLLLSSIKFEDRGDENVIKTKLDLTARYIETYTARRAINGKKFGQTSIRHGMFALIKEIRDNDLSKLGQNLAKNIKRVEQTWDGARVFVMNSQNKRFVKHLLSRISSHVDSLTGKDTGYINYHSPKGKPFEIEHIWADNFEAHRDEFEQEGDFQAWRNSIGALVLLPKGTNQSFSNQAYKKKLGHYIRENTYVQTLHPDYYERNPNFLKDPRVKELLFEPHVEFKQEDVKKRDELVQRICEQIWSIDHFTIGE